MILPFKVFLILSLAISDMAFCGSTSPDQLLLSYYFCVKEFNQGNYSKAKYFLDYVNENDHQNIYPVMHFIFGKYYHLDSSSDTNEAIREFKLFLNLDRNRSLDNFAKINLAYLYRRLGNNQVAQKYILEVMTTAKKSDEFWRDAVWCYSDIAASLAKDEINKKTLEGWERAIKILDDDPLILSRHNLCSRLSAFAHISLAERYKQEGKFEASTKECEIARQKIEQATIKQSPQDRIASELLRRRILNFCLWGKT